MAGTEAARRRRRRLDGCDRSVAADPLAARANARWWCSRVPIYATLDYMEQLAPVLGPEHLVTDVGSTKAQITAAAGRLFNTPDRAAFLPGHPMAGKERGGAALADANLFRGAVWLFTDDPTWQRSPESAELAQKLARVGGCHGLARTIDLDPDASRRTRRRGSAIFRSSRRRP